LVVTPKSTCQTSPRSGTPSFLPFQGAERRCRQGGKIIVGQVVGHGSVLDNMATQLNALGGRELLDLVNDTGNCGCYGANVSKRRRATSTLSSANGS